MSARWDCEHTDTFGGEANYCWVHRSTIEAKDAKTALRRFRREIGLAGVRGRLDDYGDSLTWHPTGHAQVVFVNWHDDSLDEVQS